MLKVSLGIGFEHVGKTTPCKKQQESTYFHDVYWNSNTSDLATKTSRIPLKDNDIEMFEKRENCT